MTSFSEIQFQACIHASAINCDREKAKQLCIITHAYKIADQLDINMSAIQFISISPEGNMYFNNS